MSFISKKKSQTEMEFNQFICTDLVNSEDVTLFPFDYNNVTNKIKPSMDQRLLEDYDADDNDKEIKSEPIGYLNTLQFNTTVFDLHAQLNWPFDGPPLDLSESSIVPTPKQIPHFTFSDDDAVFEQYLPSSPPPPQPTCLIPFNPMANLTDKRKVDEHEESESESESDNKCNKSIKSNTDSSSNNSSEDDDDDDEEDQDDYKNPATFQDYDLMTSINLSTRLMTGKQMTFKQRHDLNRDICVYLSKFLDQKQRTYALANILFAHIYHSPLKRQAAVNRFTERTWKKTRMDDLYNKTGVTALTKCLSFKTKDLVEVSNKHDPSKSPGLKQFVPTAVGEAQLHELLAIDIDRVYEQPIIHKDQLNYILSQNGNTGMMVRPAIKFLTNDEHCVINNKNFKMFCSIRNRRQGNTKLFCPCYMRSNEPDKLFVRSPPMHDEFTSLPPCYLAPLITSSSSIEHLFAQNNGSWLNHTEFDATKQKETERYEKLTSRFFVCNEKIKK